MGGEQGTPIRGQAFVPYNSKPISTCIPSEASPKECKHKVEAPRLAHACNEFKHKVEAQGRGAEASARLQP
jgi:hypothetical protein